MLELNRDNSNNAVNAIQNSTQDIKTTPMTDSLEVSKELANLGESLGQFRAYDSQLPIAEIKGTRIVKCLYQVATSGKNKGKKAQENSYVRLPTKHLTEEHVVSRVVELSSYILTWLQSEEDKSIKELHRKGGLQVHTDYLNLDNIIESLEAAQETARLTKEKIEAWFTDYVEESLTELFAAKMGLNENSSEHELHKLELVLNAYKSKFASLASPKSYLKEADCLALISVISKIELARNSILGRRFIAKLEDMNKKVDDILEML